MQNPLWLYFSLKGRLDRSGYWLFYVLPAMAIGISAYLVANSLGAVAVGNVIAFALLWPSIAVQVKRWHDIDMSGWWVLVNLLPFIGPLWSLVMNGFFASTPHENRFGPATNSLVQ
jgi:uncharacterized membrane protein YhaH (DUF805 family)